MVATVYTDYCPIGGLSPTGNIVVKDRNPKGKFKVILSAKGIITILINKHTLLLGDCVSFLNGSWL